MINLPLSQIIGAALAEDMPSGDLTTDSLDINQKFVRAKIIAKEDLVLCGVDLVTEAFRQTAGNIDLKWHFQDGDLVLNKQVIVTLAGPIAGILKGERVALNFLGRLSGIASLTRCFVKEMNGTECKILDTRKTTPTLRHLEKYAVKVGGGQNHRMNLSDAVLIKENHIAAVGGVSESIRRVRSRTKLPIEIEVTDLTELQAALAENVERVLLDNMSNQQITEALAYIPDHVFVEASGGMTLDRVRSVAELGVDFISVGALTHSAPNADVSLLIQH